MLQPDDLVCLCPQCRSLRGLRSHGALVVEPSGGPGADESANFTLGDHVWMVIEGRCVAGAQSCARMDCPACQAKGWLPTLNERKVGCPVCDEQGVLPEEEHWVAVQIRVTGVELFRVVREEGPSEQTVGYRFRPVGWRRARLSSRRQRRAARRLRCTASDRRGLVVPSPDVFGTKAKAEEAAESRNKAERQEMLAGLEGVYWKAPAGLKQRRKI